MNSVSVDNREVVKLALTLTEMHRSALPIAIRSTLNDLAFDVRQNTLPKGWNETFTVRNEKFLPAFSGVKKADGFDVNKMQSEVGIIKKSSKGSKAAEGLTKQEEGGQVKKPLFYTKQARGGSNSNMVQRKNYLNKLGFLDPSKSKNIKRSVKSQFIADAIMAQRFNKAIFWKSKFGSVAILAKGVYLGEKGAVSVNTEIIADVKSGYEKNLKKRPFLSPASSKTYNKVSDMYYQNLLKRYEKYMK
jgi:hypothetical protein